MKGGKPIIYLQKFVTDVIEAIGGIVEPVEYALCQVMIPEEYQSYFENRAELELAFDFEVAQEHPHAEFVTFGSYILDQALLIVRRHAVTGVRFVEVTQQKLVNPAKKMIDFLQNERERITVIKDEPALGLWASFQFHMTFTSDEKVEVTQEIWMDMLRGEPDAFMQAEQKRIVHQSNALYTYPFAADIVIESAYAMAYRQAQKAAAAHTAKRREQLRLENDLERIETYYSDLLEENNRRMMRKGLSAGKLKELQDKSAVIALEKDKQAAELRRKADGRTDIALEEAMLYVVPIRRYLILRGLRAPQRQTVYYNPITHRFTWTVDH
ncbi:MAG: hypothetical protein ABF868_12160 [Sporolactobacillus sp.]